MNAAIRPAKSASVLEMRSRMVHKPTSSSIDGLRLDLFDVGHEYEVGSAIGALLLAERWAEPVPVGESNHTSSAQPKRTPRRPEPPNLSRDTDRPYQDRLATAADSERRTRRR